jgi:hypothetical protein
LESKEIVGAITFGAPSWESTHYSQSDLNKLKRAETRRTQTESRRQRELDLKNAER